MVSNKLSKILKFHPNTLFNNWKKKKTFQSSFFSLKISSLCFIWLPWWLSSKDSACNTGDMGSTPGSGRSPGGGHGNPSQYSHLENLKDREAWWTTVHRVAKSLTWLKRLSIHCFFPPSIFYCSKVFILLSGEKKKKKHYLECIRINLNT